MLTKKQKKKNPKDEIIFQILFCLSILALIGFLIISNLKINKKRAELTEKIESLKKEILTLEEKKQRLEAGISQTEKESYWEEIVREQGYVREGESPLVVLPPTKEEENEKREEQNIFNPQTWWDWWEWIKSKVK